MGTPTLSFTWLSGISGLYVCLKNIRMGFDSPGSHKQGDATVVSIRIREDKKPKCKDELLQPWTTKIE